MVCAAETAARLHSVSQTYGHRMKAEALALNGAHHVRAYSRSVRISGSIRRYSIEWDDSCASIEQVLIDEASCRLLTTAKAFQRRFSESLKVHQENSCLRWLSFYALLSWYCCYGSSGGHRVRFRCRSGFPPSGC